MKYLLPKIENNETGGFFNRLCFVPSEVIKERTSDFVEDLQSLPDEDICKLFGWKETEKTKQTISYYSSTEEINLMNLLIEQNKYGFVAEVYHPVHYKFSVKEDGSRGSSWVSQGHCHIDWLYADSIGELVDKLSEQAEYWIQYDFDKEQEEKLLTSTE